MLKKLTTIVPIYLMFLVKLNVSVFIGEPINLDNSVNPVSLVDPETIEKFIKKVETNEIYFFYRCYVCGHVPISEHQNIYHKNEQKDNLQGFSICCYKCAEFNIRIKNNNIFFKFRFDIEFKTLHIKFVNPDRYELENCLDFLYQVFADVSGNQSAKIKYKAYYGLKFMWKDITTVNENAHTIKYVLSFFKLNKEKTVEEFNSDNVKNSIYLYKEMKPFFNTQNGIRRNDTINYDHIGIVSNEISYFISAVLQLLKLSIDSNICHKYFEGVNSNKNQFIIELMNTIYQLHTERNFPVIIHNFCQSYKMVVLMKILEGFVSSKYECYHGSNILIKCVEMLEEFETNLFLTYNFMELYVYLCLNNRRYLTALKFHIIQLLKQIEPNNKYKIEKLNILIEHCKQSTFRLKFFVDSILSYKNACSNESVVKKNDAIYKVNETEKKYLKSFAQRFLYEKKTKKTSEPQVRISKTFDFSLKQDKANSFMMTVLDYLIQSDISHIFKDVFCIQFLQNSNPQKSPISHYISIIDVSIQLNQMESLEELILNFIGNFENNNGLNKATSEIKFPRFLYINFDLSAIPTTKSGNYSADLTFSLNGYIYKKIGSVNSFPLQKNIYDFFLHTNRVVIRGDIVYHGGSNGDESIVCYERGGL